MAAWLFVMLTAVGRAYGLPQDLLPAVAIVESGGNPWPLDSDCGAQGMMQLTPVIQARFKVLDPMDPSQSAIGAARYLRWGKRHLGTWRLAIGAYGCGPAKAARCERYVHKVVAAVGREP